MLISESPHISTGRFIFAKFDNAVWMKLLFHNCTGNVEFADTEEALNYYNTSNPQLYSVIGTISNESKIDGRFEFIIEYPIEKKYFQWKQKHFPMYQLGFLKDNNNSTEGFELIHAPEPTTFKGLARTDYDYNATDPNCTPSLFDSDPINWKGCVGMMKCKTDWNHSTIPGIIGSTMAMYFWMKIQNSKYIVTCHQQVVHISIYVLITFLTLKR